MVVVASPRGGFTADGRVEKYTVSLLDEAPVMPSSSQMLELGSLCPLSLAGFSAQDVSSGGLQRFNYNRV